MSTIEVEIGIPMPDRKRVRVSKYPFATMPVDGSFIVPDTVKNPAQLAAQARKKHKPKLFQAREVEGGFRMWRTA